MIRLALRNADQTATTRPPSRRDPPPPVSPFPHHTLRTGNALPPVPPPTRTRDAVVDDPAGRLRAGLALSVLVTFVGVIIALTIAGGIVFVAEGLRTAVR